MHGLSIGQLAKAAKVSIHTIRFYEKSGLLPPPARRPSGYREYSQTDILQLKFVSEARSFGFTLEQIAELLTLAEDNGSASCRAMVARRLKMIDQKIARLQRWRSALQQLAERSASEHSNGSFLLRFFEGELADADAEALTSDSRQRLKDSHDEG